MTQATDNLAIGYRAKALYLERQPGHVAGQSDLDVTAMCESMFQAIDERYAPPNEAMLLAGATQSNEWPGGLDVTGEAALAWLKATHGVGVGDVVLVEGGAKPREIVIETISLSKGLLPEDRWWMSFDGPCRIPKGPRRACSGFYACEAMHKQPGPSVPLRRFLDAEKLASQQAS